MRHGVRATAVGLAATALLVALVQAVPAASVRRAPSGIAAKLLIFDEPSLPVTAETTVRLDAVPTSTAGQIVRTGEVRWKLIGAHQTQAVVQSTGPAATFRGEKPGAYVVEAIMGSLTARARPCRSMARPPPCSSPLPALSFPLITRTPRSRFGS